MVINKCIKESFSVIGKEGSTNDGEGFIEKLWEDANENFTEVEHLAKKDNKGNILGVWGAMSDLSCSFKPWEDNFTKGLYLSGVEVNDNLMPPKGWTKWTIPGYEYIYVKCDGYDTFSKVIKYLKDNDVWICGTDMDARNYYYNEKFDGPIAIVIGSEGFGMSRLVKENCDFLVKIPMKGKITSLNASVSAGIVMYEVVKQRN